MKLNWAERWAVNNPLRVIQQRLEIRWMKKRAALKSGAVVLEVGCGRGAGARLILNEFRPSLLHAQDLDMRMIQDARNYLSPEEHKKISLFVGDVFRLPYRDGALDAVFDFGVLHHVPDWYGVLSEIARILRANGVFFLEEIYPPLYQNFLTRAILLHPREGRFCSQDLKQGLEKVNLPLEFFLEWERIGIVGVSVKSIFPQGESQLSPEPADDGHQRDKGKDQQKIEES